MSTKEDVVVEVMELRGEGKSLREIAGKVGKSKSRIHQILRSFEEEGMVIEKGKMGIRFDKDATKEIDQVVDQFSKLGIKTTRKAVALGFILWFISGQKGPIKIEGEKDPTWDAEHC
jgi:transposase